ncbi:MAG: alpha/beta fold hydrolase [Acidobacteriota bacterium]
MDFIEVNGIKLAYEDLGPKDGVPLVCVHGWTANRHRWDHQAEYFPATRRFIRFDLRGHGESDKPIMRYSIKQFSEDLKGLLDKLGIEKAILAGHSMGGMTVQQFALDYPERVEKLILVDTCGRFPFNALTRTGVATCGALPFQMFVKMNIVRAFKPGFSKSKLEEFVRLSQNNPQPVVMSCFKEAMAEYDIMSRLPQIKAQTLVFHGYHDIQLTLDEGCKLAMLIPNATMKIVDSGHETPVEVPEQLTKAIAEFIQ